MESIIVATDFSAIADNAVHYAAEALKVSNGKMILFHLYKISTATANSLISTNALDEMIEMKKLKFKAYAKSLSNKYSIQTETVVRTGDFLEEIEKTAKEYQSTLLVLGMPEKSFEQDLLGNTTTASIYKLKFPILSIPESARFSDIQHILFACDVTRGIHGSILATVKEYAKLFNAAVEVFYVGKAIMNIKAQKNLHQGLEGVDFTYKTVSSDSVIRAIQQEAVDSGADLLIMTPHKYGFWSSIIHRSKTRAMASNGKIPLLSIAY